MKKNNGVDLLVSFDTTGSMYPVLAQVRQNVTEFVTDMFDSIEDIRVGVIAHGDYCDRDNPYTIRVMDLTTDKDKLCEFIKTTDKTFGGDADECYELVLNTARTTVDWGAGRTKIFVLIGDASPHGVNYPSNKNKLDWVNEAGLLNDLGVKIFAVHALSYYRSSSRKFYETIANKTDGKYLTLDQFDEVIDLIKATCMAEYSEEKLTEFVSIIRSKGRMTKTMAQNINRLSGKSYVPEVKKVQKDGLIPVHPGRFQVMKVDTNCVIKTFVEDNGIVFKRGRGFYELTKHETVQQYKEVIIQDRETGEMFTGAQVRERLGLQPQCDKGGVKESLSSRDTAEFRVFVQSTSFNRKLIGGTAFLYEVDDLVDTGTVIETVVDKKVEDKKAEKVTKKVEKKQPAKSVKKAEKAETKDKAKKVETKDKAKMPRATKKVSEKVATEFSSVDVVEHTDKSAKINKRVPTTKTTVKHKTAVEEALGTLEKKLKDHALNADIKEANSELVATLEKALKYFKDFV